ncbi:MAG: hypothetical protein JNK56_26930, partial [Myxococcales bacterium]|nr:hypothetical protein [Myxococcales bacterium]
MAWWKRSAPDEASPAPVPEARSLARKASADAAGDVFDDAFLARLELLQVIARRLFRGRQRAERKTRKV